MRRFIALLFVAALALPATGCIVHSHGHGHSRRGVVVKRKSCHPSQYWDGHKCRHKGKGHGARKHDD